jgi:uncharacterized protein YciI
MFIVQLKFSTNKTAAPEFMAAHNEWIAQGFDDGVFQCVGSLVPAAGGALLAIGKNRAELEARINEDPFVQNKVVDVELIEIDVKKTIPSLAILKG